MARQLCAFVLVMVLAEMPLRAAGRPHAGTASKNAVWTNDDLTRLQVPGLICIVGQANDGQPNEETSQPASGTRTQAKAQEAAWFAEQAAKLRDELESRRTQLDEYRQALEDARSLKETAGGLNFYEGDVAITPEAGIEVLQQRVSKAETELDALEDLARRNDIPPGILRGQGDLETQREGLR